MDLDAAIKDIKGNASEEAKKACTRVLGLYRGIHSKSPKTPTFADDIGARIKITEVNITSMENAPKRKEATVVCELTVEEDMINGGGNLHGGCSAYLIDLCSSLPLVALVGNPAVSQSLNMIYHAPAPIGTRLRIINKSISVGSRMLIARGEIWDTENMRLVASGVHNKMDASKPKVSNKL